MKMKFSALFIAAVAEAAAIARDCNTPGPDKDGRYTISAPGIKAQVRSKKSASCSPDSS